MDLELTDTQKAVQHAAREFAERVIKPQAADIDRHERFPVEILRGLGELGLLAVNVPSSLGGAEAGAVSYTLAMQEVARACASTAVTMAVTNMVGEVVARFGTEAQKAHVNPKLASAEWLAGAFALSEPEAGSDPGGMSTTAKKDGSSWVLNGAKQWITSGAHAGVFVVWARTGDAATHPGTRGISCFLVEGGTPGLRIGRAEDKMGLRGSNTVALEFEDCCVPESALLGELNGGFKIAMMALDGGRIGISAQAIGIARVVLEESAAYAKDRKQFGKPIADFQLVQQRLARMWVAVANSRRIVYADWLAGRTLKESIADVCAGKLYCAEMGTFVAFEAIHILAGNGYMEEYVVERLARDAKLLEIGGGTTEIQILTIAREILA